MKTSKIASGFCVLLAMAAVNLNRASAQDAAAQPTAGSSHGTSAVALKEDGATSRVPVIGSRLRIGPGDLVNVSVFDVPELSQTLRVSDLGDVRFQLIGSLHLSDLTTEEASTLIADKLKTDNFLLDPHVSVLISEYSTQGVSVLGEVQKPGVYQVLGTRTLLDLISEAGGTTPTAGPDITVKHADGSTVSVKLTKNAQLSLATDVELLPGDKIIIPRAGIVYVLGEVNRPGGFMMENDGNMSILQVVAMAGGANRTASMNHARLIRKTANGYTEVPVALKTLLQGHGGDMPLEAEDILFIPTNVAKSAIYRTTPALVSAASGAAVYKGIP